MKKLFALLTAFVMLLCGCTASVAEEFAVTDEPAAPRDTLVAYFSCTGTTEAVALLIAEVTGADVYKIEPEIPYNDDDLNYNNSSSRANLEINDPEARPAIAGAAIEAMDAYDVVYLGYPIWWGGVPPILRTFMESYDFSGKTIVPFCTSGSSGIGGSLNDLRTRATEATVLDGARLNGAAAETVAEWIATLELNGGADAQ